MLLSPEAFLRYPVPYEWPLNVIKGSAAQSRSGSDLRQRFPNIILLKWSSAWVDALDPFLRDLRTYRFQKQPVHILHQKRDDTKRPPFSHAVIQLANHAGFFSDDTPPLEASLFPTGIECCIAEAFMITGPMASGEMIWMETGSSPEEDWVDSKKCFFVVFLLAPGTLEPDCWNIPDPPRDSQSYLLLPEILQCSEDHHTNHAIVTDGHSTLILNIVPRTKFMRYVPPPVPFYVEVMHVSTESVAMCIAWTIYKEAEDCGLWCMYARQTKGPCLGALNAPLTPLPPFESILQRGCLADFDLYTMQRDIRHWEQFLKWRAAKVEEVGERPHLPGEILAGEKNSYAKDHILFRSSVPIPPIPQETLARIPPTRPKDAIASTATSGFDGMFTFRVTGTIRTKIDTYSQVLRGVVQHGGMESRELYLKLYDDRLFPTPNYHRTDFDFTFRPADETSQDRLLSWNPAGELAQREEAAYDRLKPYQGSLVPHSYGFHHFISPDGHRCLGFLMELIDGVSVDKAGIQDLPENSLKEFIVTLRHCLRVLRYSQIEQTDWHPEQVLVLPGPRREIVFIDFAFALQHPDTSHTPPAPDWNLCRNRALFDVLGWDRTDFVVPLWFEPDENEY